MKRFYPVPLLLTALLATAAAQGSPEATSSDQQTSGRAGASQTEMQSQPASSHSATEPPDPLLDVPPLPKGPVSLIGGKVKSVDRIRNRLVVQVFGGQAMKMSFDERSHIFRDGVETTQLGIRQGDRVYVDTMLDGTQILARNIRVETGAHGADASGQILSVDRRNGLMALQEQLSAEPVTFRIGPKTAVTREKQQVSLSDLTLGSIVAVKFDPENASRGVAREINIIAAPGMQFVFAGRVTHIDLSVGTFSLENQTDKKTYDLNFSPTAVDKRDAFGVGAEVKVVATFALRGYRTDSVSVLAAPGAAPK